MAQITSAVPAYNSPDHFQAGEAVTTSGFAGNIRRHCYGGMWEVQFDRSAVCESAAGDLVCVSGADIKRVPTAA